VNLLDLSKPKKSTRKRLLKSAESLFAKRGFGGLTLREVSQQSNTNLASAHYHFGSKEALVMEMLQCRIRPINDRRKHYIANAKAKSKGKALPTHLIFEALIAPIGEEISKSIHNRKTLAQIVARSFTEPESFIQEMHRRFFGELCELFINELCLAHPNTPKEDICWNLHFAISSMLGALAQHRRLHHFSQGLCDENDTSTMISRLILFVTHGFEAGIKSQNP
jgi:AcrR family transcriptional regulator